MQGEILQRLESLGAELIEMLPACLPDDLVHLLLVKL